MRRIVDVPGRAVSGIVVAFFCSVPTWVTAQTKGFELTPHFASFYAISSINLRDEGTAQEESEKQAAAPGFGARLTWWTSPAFGIEGSYTYVFSGSIPNFPLNDPDFQGRVALPGHVMYTSARAKYHPRRSSLSLIGGVAWVSRGGEAWEGDEYTSLTDIGGMLGFSLRARLSAKVEVDFGAELYFYSADPDGDGAFYVGRSQQDILVTIGIPIHLTKN